MLNPRVIIILLMLSSCILVALVMLKFNWDYWITAFFKRHITPKYRSRKNIKEIRQFARAFGRTATVYIESEGDHKQIAMLTNITPMESCGFMGRLYLSRNNSKKRLWNPEYTIISADEYLWDGILIENENEIGTVILSTKEFKKL